MKRLSIFLLLVLFLSNPSSVVEAEAECNSDVAIAEHLPYGFPSQEKILYREGYVASYNDARDVSNWVCYHLTKEYLDAGDSRSKRWFRKNFHFKHDDDVPGGDDRAELSDYRGRSDYERGHLAPAADMARSRITMSQSFLLTNVAPQKPDFNGGIWYWLEQNVRDWARERGDVNVCTGPIYMDDDGDGVIEFDLIGRHKVAVPDAFFKIVIARKDSGVDVIAFILKNEEYPKCWDLKESVIQIREIEEKTGLNFNPDWHDTQNQELESQDADLLKWSFIKQKCGGADK